MQFAITLNMSRERADESIEASVRQVEELVRLADRGGFDIIFAPEHHAIELTIGPNPFMQLVSWARIAERARLGTAVLAVPYWHPIRLAGEAAMCDVLTSGRLELGLGRGAYQYEFDRLGGGLSAEQARGILFEVVPAVKGLWQGDYAHDGPAWKFPAATSVPKPVQQPGPPIWIAARHPSVFELAVTQRCDVMATPLSEPFAEVVSLRERLDQAVAKDGGEFIPRLMMLRDACVYEKESQADDAVDAYLRHSRCFETLFRNVGGVNDGFVEPATLESLENKVNYQRETVLENQIFGTPDVVIERLKQYEAAGVDVFLYGATWGLDFDACRRSLELFIDEVMPAFGADKRVT